MARYFDVHPDNPQPRAISQVAAIVEKKNAQLIDGRELPQYHGLMKRDYVHAYGHIDTAKALSPGNALLIVNRGSGDSNRFLIDSDVTTVGRHPESDIFLDDITVSRHHAKFVRSAGHLYLEDLGSLNGTYVNRTLLDGRTALRGGDEIQIGKYRATISLSEPGTL